jgi:hypothetical protein
MGIGHDLIYDLIALKRGRHLDNCRSVIEVGAQQLSQFFLADSRGLSELCNVFGIAQPNVAYDIKETHLAHGALQHQRADAPYAGDFWRSLGLRYASIDIDGSPGSIPLDLNFDGVPLEHRKQYDLVTNFGTTEHVCNQFNAFKVIHDLTRRGGLMMHNLPAQGMMNHGLVNYNPKFFWMLARSNGYEVLVVKMSPAGVNYPLPDNIRDELSDDPSSRQAVASYRTEDVGLKVIMRKRFDVEFIPPIDVPTGITTDDPKLRERYWTVFEPNALDRLISTTFEAGALAFSQGDYAKAMREWLPHANSGDPEAQSGVAMLYANGLGVSKDDAKAANWFLTAANGGHRESQMIMSVLCDEGRGVPRDARAALTWVEQAAKAGHPPAQAALGMRYMLGDGVAVDEALGSRWLRDAARYGDAAAQQAVEALAARKRLSGAAKP